VLKQRSVAHSPGPNLRPTLFLRPFSLASRCTNASANFFRYAASCLIASLGQVVLPSAQNRTPRTDRRSRGTPRSKAFCRREVCFLTPEECDCRKTVMTWVKSLTPMGNSHVRKPVTKGVTSAVTNARFAPLPRTHPSPPIRPFYPFLKSVLK
jgi:hypothetical protein